MANDRSWDKVSMLTKGREKQTSVKWENAHTEIQSLRDKFMGGGGDHSAFFCSFCIMSKKYINMLYLLHLGLHLKHFSHGLLNHIRLGTREPCAKSCATTHGKVKHYHSNMKPLGIRHCFHHITCAVSR